MQKHYKLAIGFLVCVLGVSLEGAERSVSPSGSEISEYPSTIMSSVAELREACLGCDHNNIEELFLILARISIAKQLQNFDREELFLARRAKARLCALLKGGTTSGKRNRCQMENAPSLSILATGPYDGPVQMCELSTGYSIVDRAIYLGSLWPVKIMSDREYYELVKRFPDSTDSSQSTSSESSPGELAKLVEVLNDREQIRIEHRDFFVIPGQRDNMFIFRNDDEPFDLSVRFVDGAFVLSKNLLGLNLTRICGLEWSEAYNPNPVHEYDMDLCWVFDPANPPEHFFNPESSCINPFVIKKSDDTVDKDTVYSSYFSPVFNEFIFVQMPGFKACEETINRQLLREIDPSIYPGPYYELIKPENLVQDMRLPALPIF